MASEKAWALATLCLKQGRISAATHARELVNATADYEAAVARLAMRPAQVAAADSATWGFDKLRREAPQLLAQLHQQDPGTYQALRDLYTAEIRAKGQKKPGCS
jgi:hypothetical protein